MDAKDKDDSGLRRREEMLARRVGEALDQLDPRAAVECPDAEVIAAYAEQALAPPESARWESHFATCARCRKILGVLAASDDTPLAEKEVTRLGELVSAARSPAELKTGSPAPSRSRFLKWPAPAAWLAPALGVAAVLAVWIAMRGPWRATNRGASTTLIAQAPREEAPPNAAPAERLSKAAPGQVDKAEATPANQLPTNALQNKRDTGLPASPAPLPPAEAKAMEASSAPQSAANVERGVAREGSQDEAAALEKSPSPSKEKKSSALQRATGGLVVPELAPQVATNTQSRQSITAVKTAGPTSIQATSPFGTTIWRGGRGGKIEYSADSGQSWSAQVSPSQEDWLAGAAVSDTVCWLSGRNGAIARTADGEHWERVAPPAEAAGTGGKLPDWTGVTANDALNARVTAGDGRRFTTQDGGKTWQVP